MPSLERKLHEGDKAGVANESHRKFIRMSALRFEINEEKIRAEARSGGKWVLRTNLAAPSEVVAMTYEDFWMVEALFRFAKSLLETRPVFHRRGATIHAHVFVSFLALVLMRELQDRMATHGFAGAERAHVLRNLKALTESEVETWRATARLRRSAPCGSRPLAHQVSRD